MLRDIDRSLAVPTGLTQVERCRIDGASGDIAPHGEHHGGRQSLVDSILADVLVQGVERVSLEKVGLLVGTEAFHRCVVLVIRQGSRLIDEPPSQQVQTPSEVDVLEEHEIPLVEALEGVEHRSAHEHRRSSSEKHVVSDIRLRGHRLGSERLVTHAIPGHGRADIVNELAVPVEHLARDRSDPG